MVGLRNEFGRGVLRGATDFALLHQEWSLISFEPHQLLEPDFCERYSIDGLIVHLNSKALYEAARNSQRPFINVSNREFFPPVPTVTSDDVAVGRMTARYLIEKRHRRLAFCGQKGKRSFDQRYQGFAEQVRLQGLELYQIWIPEDESEAYYRPVQEQEIEVWLRQLPTPVAIFTASDRFALYLLNLCVQHGFRVPEDFSIVGADNDLMKCQMSRIPFTSVQLGVEMVGYRAAKTLSGMLGGTPPDPVPVYIPPVRIVERASSDIFSIDDPLLQRVLLYIRENLHRPLSVAELAEQAHLSRRTLERRWRKTFNSSPQQDVRRMRVQTARELLLSTELSCEEIASSIGLPDGRSLTLLFQSMCDQSPTEVRKNSPKSR